MTKVAAVQMVSTPVVSENKRVAERLIREAADKGAELVLLPEYWSAIGLKDIEKLAVAEPYGNGPIQDFMAQLAQRYKIWLIGGTLSLFAPDANKVLNTTLVYRPDGVNVARYDLRFPELYRALGECQLMVVPAAFTYTTGQVHWEILLRARAIENQTYILAAAQGGRHVTGRRTWGHSMLIDPWGQIRSVCVEGEGLAMGDIDETLLSTVREKLPALKHRQL